MEINKKTFQLLLKFPSRSSGYLEFTGWYFPPSASYETTVQTKSTIPPSRPRDTPNLILYRQIRKNVFVHCTNTKSTPYHMMSVQWNLIYSYKAQISLSITGIAIANSADIFCSPFEILDSLKSYSRQSTTRIVNNNRRLLWKQ